jgi:hypothetical protein
MILNVIKSKQSRCLTRSGKESLLSWSERW